MQTGSKLRAPYRVRRPCTLGCVEIEIRPYRQADRCGPAAVVQAVFEEYGFVLDVAGWDSDLADIEAAYLSHGSFWVAVEGEKVVGCVGVKPHDERSCELKRLYVLASHRGHNLGELLSGQVLDWAARCGYERVELWSDKKFPHAHALYRRLGFEVFDECVNDDPDRSHEWAFALDLGEGAYTGAGVEMTTPAGELLLSDRKPHPGRRLGW